MGVDGREFLDRWHRMVAERDVSALDGLIAEDISMGAPPYWTRLEGKPMVMRLLGIIVTTFEDFQYHREWVDGGELALEFTAKVEGLDLHGVDLISVDDDGRMRRLDVMIRPLNALTKLASVVRDKIQAAG